MRDWLSSLDEIDRDCVHKYEYLLGRKLKDYNEYAEIDGQVDEMVLEFEGRKEFFEAHPELKKYRNQA
jgi:hypothetical protein